MKKQHVKKILDRYISAEKEITDLDDKFGIRIWDSRNENFYNKFNYVIFELLDMVFTEKGRMLIEDYVFNQTNITFDELWERLISLKND